MEEHRMKLKRFGALALTLALTLSLAVLPAHAASFPDIENHWAREYIEDMKTRGYAAGSTDGNFYPERNMSATESLLFCARVTGIAEETRNAIYADRGAQVTAVLPASVAAWGSGAVRELSVAVESGILSLDELEALGATAPASQNSSSGPQPYLLWNISRENVCMYLVRAMQLEPLARTVSDEQCLSYLRSRYADADQIAPALRPYVYILTYYKVFSGLDNSEGVRIADPKGAIKRCQMIVLMSQALKVMEDLGIKAELSEYTDYDWVSGRITNVTTELDGGVILTLESEISGTHTCRIPVEGKIYEDNMLADVSFLRNGKYVRLNLNDKGEAMEARLSGTLTTHQGLVAALNGDKVTLLEGGVSRTYTMDRFTEVQANGQTGGREVIDAEAGYTNVTCYVDETGHLAGVTLWGGTTQVRGIISSLTLAADGSATMTLAAPNGVATTYGIPASAAVTVNGFAGTLAATQVRYSATLRVNENEQVTAAAVDTLTVYRQGRVVRQGTSGGSRTVIISDVLDSNREVSAVVDEKAVITYNGETRTTAQIENDWFVTARLSSGVIVEMEAYPANVTVEGNLASLNYGATTVLTVNRPDGGTVSYELDLNQLPSITRSGKKSTLFELRTGDSLVITLRYNKVDQIASTPRQPDLTGKVAGFSTDTSGSTIVLTLSDGSTRTFTVGNGVSVTKNGAAATFRDINQGDTVALVTSGDEALSIDITAAASQADRLSGTVLITTNQGNTRSVTILPDDRTDPVTVDLRTGSARIIDRNGSSLTLNSLKVEDRVEVYGSFQGTTFVATLVIKQ